MGAAKLKARTTITQHDEQEVSLRSLEVLPELLQVRARLDKGWSLEYSKGYARGDAFPPILAYRLPDGRLVVTDGFHRIDACLAIGLKSIRAQIREGTIHEALLAAVEANMGAFHRGRPFDVDDRRNAVKMMLADEEFWLWADVRIANHCGLSPDAVKRIRADFAAERGIDLPLFVFKSDGAKCRYSRKRYTPHVHERRLPGGIGFEARISGKRVYLGTNRDQAERKLEVLDQEYKEKQGVIDLNVILGKMSRLRVNARALVFHVQQYPHLKHVGVCDGAIFVVARLDRDESVPWAVGVLFLARQYHGDADSRMVVVCHVDRVPTHLVALAIKLGVEFLSPFNFIASLDGHEDGDAPE